MDNSETKSGTNKPSNEGKNKEEGRRELMGLLVTCGSSSNGATSCDMKRVVLLVLILLEDGKVPGRDTSNGKEHDDQGGPANDLALFGLFVALGPIRVGARGSCHVGMSLAVLLALLLRGHCIG